MASKRFTSVYGNTKSFIGIVKFYDEKKDFGFINSNNCNIKSEEYVQEFYFNKSSIIGNACISDNDIVVFQIAEESLNKVRATNVRLLTDKPDDVQLLLSYCDSHEIFYDKNKSAINIFDKVIVPLENINVYLKRIINQSINRTPDDILEILKLNFKRFPKLLWSMRDYEFQNNGIFWRGFFEDLDNNEILVVLQSYPISSLYVKDIGLIEQALESKLQNGCTVSDLKDISVILKGLTFNPSSLIYTQFERVIIQKMEKETSSLGETSGITEKEYLAKISPLWALINNKDLFFVQKFLAELRSNAFYKAIELINESSEEVSYEQVFETFLLLDHNKDEVQQLIKSKILKIFDLLCESENYGKALRILNIIQKHDSDLSSFLLLHIYPNFKAYLKKESEKRDNVDIIHPYNDIAYVSTKFFSFLTDNDQVELKGVIVDTLKKTSSIFYASWFLAESEFFKFPFAELELITKIVSRLSFDELKGYIDNEENIYILKDDYKKIIVQRLIKGLEHIPIEGTREISEDNNKEFKTIDKQFVKHLEHFSFKSNENTLFSQFINTRSFNEVLYLHRNKISDCIPSDFEERLLSRLTLEDFESSPDHWYHKPTLKDVVIEQILKNSNKNLVPIIGKVLCQLKIELDNIPLACALTELMRINPLYSTIVGAELDKIRIYNSNKELDVILWAIFFKTSCSKSVLFNAFSCLPPYLQIISIKKLFQLKEETKIEFTAKQLYENITLTKKICLPLEITFIYLINKEGNKSNELNDSILLNLLDTRDDFNDWIGIRQLTTTCPGRCVITQNSKKAVWKKDFYNGRISFGRVLHNNLMSVEILVYRHMIDEFNQVQKYNNKYYNDILSLLEMTYSKQNISVQYNNYGYKVCLCTDDKIELLNIADNYRLYYDSYAKGIEYSIIHEDEEMFCECRLSKKIHSYTKMPFYWCLNKECHRSPVLYHLPNEWENYTILDFMRILNLSVDYVQKNGIKTKFGYYTILLSYLKSFARLYEHLKCRECGNLLKPRNLTNYHSRSVDTFECINEKCSQKGKIIYLNHCFNKRFCNGIIDSRDSKKCPNNQYICPKCGACCSTDNYRRKIQTLEENGGQVSDVLKSFVNNHLGHWEKGEFYCYKCGHIMDQTIDPKKGLRIYTCPQCGHKIGFKI